MVKKGRLKKTFLSLIKINSISLHEERIQKYLKRELNSLGLKTYIDGAKSKAGGETGNLIGFLKGNIKNSKTIMLNAHVDTVSSGLNIKPRIKNGIIRSDGRTILGADDKAGVAIILEILKVIKERKIPHGNIQVVFTIAEEIGLLGAKALAKKNLKADFGFAMDGGAVDIILNKAPSQDNIEAKIIGKAAHAGVHPEDGINAIEVASHAIASMELGRIDKETTANIGIIKGGQATNIIPEKVLIKGEARSLDLAKLKSQIERMRTRLKQACKKFRAKLKIKISRAYHSFYVPEKHKVTRLAVEAIESLGMKPKIKSTGGGSDANIFNRLGIPTIILGTGAVHVHTKKEKIKINDMVKSAKLLLEVLRLAGKETNL